MADDNSFNEFNKINQTENADVALALAKSGQRVFPCDARKRPMAKWTTEASSDPEIVEQFWARAPDALVGLVTGISSGILVVDLDVDRETGEARGEESLEAIGLGRLLTDPSLVRVRTPSGGLHLYFAMPDAPLRNSVGRLAPGIDTRGEGGYVIAPGSVGPAGAYRPECEIDWRALPPIPADLLEKLTGGRGAAQAPSSADAGNTAWAEAAIESELARLRETPPGRRNDQLNASAFAIGQVAAGAGIDVAGPRHRLCAGGIEIGLDAREVAATVESGLMAGLRSPRVAKDAEPDFPAADETEGSGEASHDDLARQLGATGWDRDAKFVSAWGRWLFWSGASWVMDDQQRATTKVRDFLRARAQEILADAEEDDPKARRRKQRIARDLGSRGVISAVEALAQSNPLSRASPDDFDRDRLLLGTPGGTVDLRTGKLRPADRGDMITKSTTVTPEPGRAELWRKFLDEIFNGDREVVDFIQRAAGYALTGETTEHKLLFLYGTGRNGKSVFLDVLATIMGDYARRVPATALLASQNERHPTEIATLRGARLAISSELPAGRVWNEAILKDLTGGDRITARLMRGDFFEFIPQLTLVIAGNAQPGVRAVDEAMRARMVMVPFAVTIPAERRDPHLLKKLLAEGPQILDWAIEGGVEWQRRGLDVPASVAEASAHYLDAEDIVGQFLADEADLVSGAISPIQEIYSRFQQYMTIQGLAPWTQTTLTKELRSRRFVDAKSNGRRGLRGIRLRGA